MKKRPPPPAPPEITFEDDEQFFVHHSPGAIALFMVVFIVALVAFGYLFLPYVTDFILAFMFTGLFRGTYERLRVRLGDRSLTASALVTALIAVLVAETVITLIDFVEEDRSRKLPASERVTHTLLALNYGAILVLLLPIHIAWAEAPSGLAWSFHGYWSLFMLAASLGVMPFGVKDLAAARAWPG